MRESIEGAGRTIAHARTRLRKLDACLDSLENALARDQRIVDDRMARQVSGLVPAVNSRMQVADAVSLVLAAQAPLLSRINASQRLTGRPESRASPPPRTDDGDTRRARVAGPPGRVRVVVDAVRATSLQRTSDAISLSGQALAQPSDREDAPRHHAARAGRNPSANEELPLDEAGARELTDRVRRATVRACTLLLEAHRGRAWRPLGYSSWQEYVRAEFNLSRSRSYELLDLARVIQHLESAAGVSGFPDISAYAASQIKPHLDEVTEAIRASVATLPAHRVVDVAYEVIREQRSRIVMLRTNSGTGARASREALLRIGEAVGRPGGREEGPEPHAALSEETASRMWAAISCLACMPPAHQMAAFVKPPDSRLTELVAAIEWLGEFAGACGQQSTTVKSA